MARREPGPGKPTEPPDDATRERAREVRRRLRRALPRPVVELRFEDPWQLLVATILAARNTDANVNRVTPALFARFPTPRALADAAQEEVEPLVRSTGFFRNKARAIRNVSRAIVEEHGGEVPRDMASLVVLPGVARKTANVVLGSAHGVAGGIVVDVHGTRVSNRLGLVPGGTEDPVEIERVLCALFPRRDWVDMGHRFTLHGRYVCTARKPACADCPLAEVCPSAGAEPRGRWTRRADVESTRVLGDR